jgi:wyosine [tRNA(Phe)-imidazoG37] synthetase (radical SAM superfamily)
MVSCVTEPTEFIPDQSPRSAVTAFGCARDFQDNQFVYTVVSPRARGLSVGVNLNPSRDCNYDCVYCEVDRTRVRPELKLEIPRMQDELERMMRFVLAGRLRERPDYRKLPDELLTLRHVALSGDGEPTLSPLFPEALESVIHLRACRRVPFFKIVVITNTSGLGQPRVDESLELLTLHDEVWAKLDAGTEEHLQRVNHTDRSLERIMESILTLARKRPVVIQSLFAAVRGVDPSASEIEAYVSRLAELKRAGAQIPLVQIYSATRPTTHPGCGHLSLRQLARIAQRVREGAGLRVEVY